MKHREITELPTCASASRVAALNKKALNNTVKDGFIVVTFEAELDEVSNSFRCFFRPELDV